MGLFYSSSLEEFSCCEKFGLTPYFNLKTTKILDQRFFYYLAGLTLLVSFPIPPSLKLRRISRGGLEPALSVAEWGGVKKQKYQINFAKLHTFFTFPLTPPTPSLEKRGKKARGGKRVKGVSLIRLNPIIIAMKVIISKTTFITGKVLVPASKSQTIRGLVFALLASGQSILTNPLNSEDTEIAIKVCRALGAKIILKKNKIKFHHSGLSVKPKVNTGNSGITTRFILPILGLRKNHTRPSVFNCGSQMRARPIKALVIALNNLGMEIQYLKKSGQCPLLVKGKLVGGDVEVDGTTSQYLSSLLISLPLVEKNSIVRVKNLHERPYVEMTLKWLDDLGIKYFHKKLGQTDIYKIPGKQTYSQFQKCIPGDFSSASTLIVASCLLGKKVVIEGLDLNDQQGDKKIIDILQKMGAKIEIFKSKLIINQSKGLRGMKIDANSIPDLVPTLAVLGTQAKGRTQILNVQQARIKETDRLHSMTVGLRVLGAKIQELSDGLVVYKSDLKGAKVKGFNDHRTVMALTLAGMLAEGKTIISDAQAINKTFPNFFIVMKKLGVNLKIL